MVYILAIHSIQGVPTFFLWCFLSFQILKRAVNQSFLGHLVQCIVYTVHYTVHCTLYSVQLLMWSKFWNVPAVTDIKQWSPRLFYLCYLWSFINNCDAWKCVSCRGGDITERRVGTGRIIFFMYFCNIFKFD